LRSSAVSAALFPPPAEPPYRISRQSLLKNCSCGPGLGRQCSSIEGAAGPRACAIRSSRLLAIEGSKFGEYPFEIFWRTNPGDDIEDALQLRLDRDLDLLRVVLVRPAQDLERCLRRAEPHARPVAPLHHVEELALGNQTGARDLIPEFYELGSLPRPGLRHPSVERRRLHALLSCGDAGATLVLDDAPDDPLADLRGVAMRPACALSRSALHGTTLFHAAIAIRLDTLTTP